MLHDIHTLTEKLSVSLKSELHYNHSVFLILTDIVPDGIIITDGGGDIRVTSSKALELLLIQDEGGLNGTNILECFPSIADYEKSGTKLWSAVEFVSASGDRKTKLDVLVSKIELKSDSSTTPGSNCVILLRCRVDAPQSDSRSHTVDRYTLTSSVDGQVTYMSPNLQKLLVSRPNSTMDMRHLVGSDIFDKFVSGNRDVKNVDVQVLDIEVADLYIRSMVVYKTNIADSAARSVVGYSLMMFDVNGVSCSKDRRSTDAYALNAVKSCGLPSVMVRLDGWKPVYCNKHVLTELGVYPTDFLNQSIFSALFGRGSEAPELADAIGSAIRGCRSWSGTVRALRHGHFEKCELSVDPYPSSLCSFTLRFME